MRKPGARRGRVVEAGLQGQIGVVHKVRVERDGRPAGGPPNRLTKPPLRAISTAHCQASGVATASKTRSAPRPPGVKARAAATGSSTSPSAAPAPRRSVRAASIWSPRLTKAITCNPASEAAWINSRPMGPAPSTMAVCPACARLVHPAHHAGQRLCQRRMFKGHAFRQEQRVLFHDTRRHMEELRIGAVVEEQIIAEVLLTCRRRSSRRRALNSMGPRDLLPKSARPILPAPRFQRLHARTALRQ